jgi:predicted nucleic acid-binding protein
LPTTYLLDTNTITALANGHPTAWNHLRTLNTDDEIVSCFIVVGEWEYGIQNASGPKRQAQIGTAGHAIFSALTAVWESTPAIALQYGTIQARLRSIRQLVPTNDIWIAATALINDATVVSSDPHFRRIPTLKVVDWTQP